MFSRREREVEQLKVLAISPVIRQEVIRAVADLTKAVDAVQERFGGINE